MAPSLPKPPDKVNNITDIGTPSNVSFSSVVQQAAPDNSIKVGYGTGPLQFGRLYLPLKQTAEVNAPLLVFVHGGCWLNAYDLSHATAFAQAIAAEGIAVWSIEYRRVGDSGGGWPGSLKDVEQGLIFALNNLNDHGLDKSRIAIAGHSAGGQLALLAATNTQPESLRSIIGLAAITDLTLYGTGSNSCQRATADFIGGSSSQYPGRYKLASPQGQQLPGHTLLLHGSSDTIVPLNQAMQSGIPYSIVEGAGHFDWLHPKTQAFKQLMRHLQEQFAK